MASSNLLGALNIVGVVTAPVGVIVLPSVPVLPMAAAPSSSQSTTISQLGTDWKTLATEFQSLAAKSGVTLADVESLVVDSQAIVQTGFQFNAKNLQSTMSELANAVASSTSTANAQNDFDNLFTGSSVSTTVIDKTFSDLVKTITDSNVTTTDLSTVASDEAAVESDISGLFGGWASGLAAFQQSVAGPSATVSSTGAVSPAVQGATPSNSTPVTPPALGVPVSPIPQLFARPFEGYTLLTSLDYVGVVTHPVLVNPTPPTSQNPNTTVQQLATAFQALQTELQSLAAKSGLTVAELESLIQDGQAIAQAGFHFSPTALNKVISELATAVAGGTSTTQAQSDFTALFSGSSVSSTVITSTYNDLVKAIGSSNVTTTDLSTVASDEAAIQTDRSNLPSSGKGGTGSGSSGSTGSGNSGNTGSGSSGSTGSGSSGSTGSGSSGSTGSGTTGSESSGSPGSGSSGSSGSGSSGSSGSGSSGSTGSGSSGNTSGSKGHKPGHPTLPTPRSYVVRAASHETKASPAERKKR